jgi:outer membrane protein OmpA-like peptidoglycan-associated protein
MVLRAVLMLCVFSLSGAGAGGARGAEGTACTDADRYLQLVGRTDLGPERRRQILEEALDACADWRFYMRLTTKLVETGGRIEATLPAARSFSIASSDRERAESARYWAQLVYEEGDPQRAYPKILLAASLDAGNPEIESLRDRIQARIDAPLPEDIKRGWADLVFTELEPAETTARKAPVVAQRLPAAVPDPAPRSDGGAGKVPEVSRAILTSIYFKYNSSEIDESSVTNLRRLADEMASDRYSGSKDRFRLVGHSDERGSEAVNQPLSVSRADAVRSAILLLYPQLRGRIDAEGAGASRPLVRGARSEDDHRRNRRLEVIRLSTGEPGDG